MMLRLTAAFVVAAFSLDVLVQAKTIKITNKEYDAPAMLFGLGEPVVVSAHDEVDSVQYWDAEQVDGGYQLKNTFAECWVSADGKENTLVGLTKDDAETFFFQPAEGGAYLIKFPYEDLVWDLQNSTDTDCFEGVVRMAPQNGMESQRWYIQDVTP